MFLAHCHRRVDDETDNEEPKQKIVKDIKRATRSTIHLKRRSVSCRTGFAAKTALMSWVVVRAYHRVVRPTLVAYRSRGTKVCMTLFPEFSVFASSPT